LIINLIIMTLNILIPFSPEYYKELMLGKITIININFDLLL